MIKTIVSTFVPHEVDIVFQHISDFKNMVEYNSSVLKSEIISASSILPCYKIEVDMGIKKFTGEYKVLEIIKNNKIIASCETKDLKFEDTYLFESKENGTQLTIKDNIELKGILALSEILLTPIMKFQMNSNLHTFIKILDSTYS